MLLLILLVAVSGGSSSEWLLELSPLEIRNGVKSRYRVDVLGGPMGGRVSSAIVCKSLHAPSVGSTCDSDGFVRMRQSPERTIVVDESEYYTLVDVVMSDGERCLKEMPNTNRAAVEEAKSAIGPTNDTTPWYYYTVVIIACCIVAAVFLIVVLGAFKGKQSPFVTSFREAYYSKREMNRKLASETLGLFQPETSIILDDE